MKYRKLPFFVDAVRYHNHCVPVAFAALAGMDTAGFEALCERAYRLPNPANESGDTLLHRRGGSVFWFHSFALWMRLWAQECGLTVVSTEKVDYQIEGRDGWQEYTNRWGERVERRKPIRRVGRPTLAQFCREHRHGRWLVDVAGHVVAVINGRALGWYGPRSRVQLFAEVRRVA